LSTKSLFNIFPTLRFSDIEVFSLSLNNENQRIVPLHLYESNFGLTDSRGQSHLLFRLLFLKLFRPVLLE
jgi:hypothetical protein